MVRKDMMRAEAVARMLVWLWACASNARAVSGGNIAV